MLPHEKGTPPGGLPVSTDVFRRPRLVLRPDESGLRRVVSLQRVLRRGPPPIRMRSRMRSVPFAASSEMSDLLYSTIARRSLLSFSASSVWASSTSRMTASPTLNFSSSAVRRSSASSRASRVERIRLRYFFAL